MGRKIYLCGGINSLTDAEAKDWRREAADLLCARGMAVLDPMARDYRGKEDESVELIVKGDLDDIRSCDAILVNATRPSWGTAMEIVYASKLNGKKCVAFVDPGKPVSPWLRYHCTIATSLAAAVEVI